MGSGGTSYQRAETRRHLQRWQAELEAGKRNEISPDPGSVGRMASYVRIPPIVRNQAASLSQECAAAASALTGVEETGVNFGSRRGDNSMPTASTLILLRASSLVRTWSLLLPLGPSAEAGAAQVSMLRAAPIGRLYLAQRQLRASLISWSQLDLTTR